MIALARQAEKFKSFAAQRTVAALDDLGEKLNRAIEMAVDQGLLRLLHDRLGGKIDLGHAVVEARRPGQ